jgi:hypothetical protein
MKIRERSLYSQPGVFPELQNVGADSKGLSPFLAFWRSVITPPRNSIDGNVRKNTAWMAVDVSPARATNRRHPILEFLSSALETLATHPPVGLDAVQAHDYWLPDDLVALRRPHGSLRDEPVDKRSLSAEPVVPTRVHHIRISRTHRSRRRVGATRRDN